MIKKTLKIVLIILASVLVYVWLAGFDGPAPSDADLLVQDQDPAVPDPENGYIALSNLLVRLDNNEGDSIIAESILDTSTYESAPQPHEILDTLISYEFDLLGSSDRFDPSAKDAWQKLVSTALTSNQWLLAEWERIANFRQYAAPTGDPMIGLFSLHRTVIASALDLYATRGEWDRMIALLESDRRIIDNLTARGKSMYAYLIGSDILEQDLDLIEKISNQANIPSAALKQLHAWLTSTLPALDKETLVRALKWQYANCKMQVDAGNVNDLVDFGTWMTRLFKHRTGIKKALCRPLARYVFQRNRYATAAAADLRDLLAYMDGKLSRREFVQSRRQPKWLELIEDILPGALHREMVQTVTRQNMCIADGVEKKRQKTRKLASQIAQYCRHATGRTPFPLIKENGIWYSNDRMTIYCISPEATELTVPEGVVLKTTDGGNIRRLVWEKSDEDELEGFFAPELTNVILKADSRYEYKNGRFIKKSEAK